MQRKATAAKVDVDQPVPIILGDVDERLHRLFDTGIVEGEVEPTERFDSPLQARSSHHRHSSRRK